MTFAQAALLVWLVLMIFAVRIVIGRLRYWNQKLYEEKVRGGLPKGAMTPKVYAERPEITAERESGWVNFHPEDLCHACGSENPLWHADTELWYQAMGVRDTDGGGIVCPNCFIDLWHQATGADGVLWRLSLTTTTFHERTARRHDDGRHRGDLPVIGCAYCEMEHPKGRYRTLMAEREGEMLLDRERVPEGWRVKWEPFVCGWCNSSHDHGEVPRLVPVSPSVDPEEG